MTLDEPTSPILVLQAAIGSAIANIAPERKDDLMTFVTEKKVQFELDDGHGAKADPGRMAIVLGSVLLERLWARSLAYYVFYTEMADEKNAEPTASEFDPNANVRRQQAGYLLRWALEGELSTPPRKLKWPSSAPLPVAHPEQGSDSECANEVFLCATAFIQHHELAHLRLQHQPRLGDDPAVVAESVDQERDADYSASDWILGAIHDNDPRYVKRVMGLAVALLALASPQAYTQSSARTHPEGYNRLMFILSRHVPDPNHLAWAVVGSMLSLHVQHARLPCSYAEQTTWKGVTDQLVDILSRAVR